MIQGRSRGEDVVSAVVCDNQLCDGCGVQHEWGVEYEFGRGGPCGTYDLRQCGKGCQCHIQSVSTTVTTTAIIDTTVTL